MAVQTGFILGSLGKNLTIQFIFISVYFVSSSTPSALCEWLCWLEVKCECSNGLQDETNGLHSTFKMEESLTSSLIALYLPCLYSSELKLPNTESTCFMVFSLFLLYFQLPEGQMSSVSWTDLAVTFHCIQHGLCTQRPLSDGFPLGHNAA